MNRNRKEMETGKSENRQKGNLSQTPEKENGRDMHPIINHLVQLQELTLIREEERVTWDGKHLEQLDASIRGMTTKLPTDVRGIFETVRKKDLIAVAPISNGACAGCGMGLAISQIQAIRLEREVQVCPNCSRILYYTESLPRRVSKRARRTEPRKIGITRFSSENLIIPTLESEDMEGIICELACLMESEGFVDSGDKLTEAALRREAILGTAVEHGLAFPHARGVEGGGLALAMGISRKGVKFNPKAPGLSHLIFFIAIPTAANAFYLKLLSGLAQTFNGAEARKTLMAEEDRKKLWKTLVKLTRRAIP